MQKLKNLTEDQIKFAIAADKSVVVACFFMLQVKLRYSASNN